MLSERNFISIKQEALASVFIITTILMGFFLNLNPLVLGFGSMNLILLGIIKLEIDKRKNEN